MVPSYTGDVVAGPDGEMWFQATYTHNFVRPGVGDPVPEVDRISTDGQIGSVASPLATSALTRGPESSVWLINENHIGKLSADGHVTEFPLSTQFPTTNTVPQALTEGPEGNIWFTGLHYLGNVGGPSESVEVIGRLTPAGEISEFPLVGKELGLRAIAPGPDGNVWFTEFNANKIGRITPSGQISEFAIPTAEARPSDITAGPDGNLWFTEQRLHPPVAIGRIDPSGRISELPLSGDAVYPDQIVSGPDGRLWFTSGLGAIDTLATNGHVTRIALPRRTGVRAIAAGPDGDVWYTAYGDPPCEGGGGTCMMQIPKEPGIVGRIEPAALSVAVIGSQVGLHGRHVKLRLACGGGDASDQCRGAVRLTRRTRGRSGGNGKRGVLLAKRRYTISTDTNGSVSLRLRRQGLSLSRRHRRFSMEAKVTIAGGKTIVRRLVLDSGTGTRRHARHHRR